MLEGSIYFDKNDPLFREHFPGNPIVPGSVVIRELLKTAEDLGLNFQRPVTIKQFKFRNFLKPGKYKYILEQTTKGIKCSLLSDAGICVTGRII